MAEPLRHLVVIGGGQSAKGLLAAAAEMIARGERALRRLRVTVVESGWEFGTGLAWSRQYALEEHLSSLAAPSSRVTYGDRQQTQFHELVRLLKELGVSVTLRPGRTAVAVEPCDGGVRVTAAAADGRHETLTADYIVVGTGHWRVRDPLEGCPGYHPSPWPAARLQEAVLDTPAGAKRVRDVLILGAYLNGIDAALSLAFRAGTFRTEPDGRVRFDAPANLRITLASRTGRLPKVWGRAPEPYEARWCTPEALDALIADPASGGTLPLDRAFELLQRELSSAGARGARREPPVRFPARVVLDRMLRTRTGTTAEQLRRDIASVTRSGRPWGTYRDAQASAWQKVLFGTLPLWSEYSHRLSAEDQAFFDREVRTLFFNYSMPMALDNAVKLDAMMRSGHLRVIALGRSYTCRPSRRGRGLEVEVQARPRPLVFTHVVNALGQSPDVTRHPAPLVQQMLREGLAQPGLRAFRHEPSTVRGDGEWHGMPTMVRQGARHLVTGGLHVNPGTRELVPAGGDGRPGAPRLFAMGPTLLGQFVDAQGIGQIERDAQRILRVVSRSLA